MRRPVLAVAAAALASGALLVTAPAALAQETGTVYVVHGIPDTPVDVYVDGQRALDDFAPGTNAGPVDLPAGDREITIFAADAPDDSGEPVLSATATVPADGNATIVAHLTEAGQPTITPFVNDITDVPAGQARLVVRHTAAAPTVDILAGGTPVVSGLTNPDDEALDVPAGTVSAAVAAAGTTEPVIGPADLDLTEGTATFVHAIGSLEDGNLDLVAFTIDGLHSAPSGVPSGAPSGAPSGSGVPIGLLVLGVAGGAVALTAGARAAAARR
jgi:hypothetical protein